MSSQRRWLLFWLWILTSFCVLGSLVGCTGVSPSASRASAPLFLPTTEDASRLEMLRHQLDRQALKCIEAANCEQISFARALVSLFENQEAARASFRHVIEHNAASPLASSSQLWLRLIGEQAGAASTDEWSSASTRLVADFVRDWMERQVAEYRKAEKATTLTTIQEVLAEQSRHLQGIQKQVRDRDRQIAILRSQLEALKLIDEDNQETQRKVKPPASLIPTADHVR